MRITFKINFANLQAAVPACKFGGVGQIVIQETMKPGQVIVAGDLGCIYHEYYYKTPSVLL